MTIEFFSLELQTSRLSSRAGRFFTNLNCFAVDMSRKVMFSPLSFGKVFLYIGAL